MKSQKGWWFLLSALVVAGCANQGAPLGADELRDVEATLAAYRQAWLEDDRATVLDTLSDEIVLFLPGETRQKVVGKEAVRDLWFPDSGVRYPVREYEISGQEIFGSGTFAAALGHSDLTWETVENGTITGRTVSRSDFITVLRKEGDGWKIFRQMYQMRE